MNRPTDRSIVVRNVVIGFVIVASVAAVALYWNREKLFSSPVPSPIPEPGRSAGATHDGDLAGAEGGVPDGPVPPISADTTYRSWTDLFDEPPTWPDQPSEAPGCEEADRELRAVCRLLDDRVSDLQEIGGAFRMIREVGEDLASRPPRPASELRSFDQVLSNVFHVFRVLGRDRIRLLKRSLDDQADLVEPLALASFRWAISRENCHGDEASSIRIDRLYDYSAFLFNTMGGQAYLRRRSPRTETLTCFYALQILDASIERGHNPLGLDPRPEIRRCRELVQGQSLVFAADYVDTLDRMEQRWSRR